MYNRCNSFTVYNAVFILLVEDILINSNRNLTSPITATKEPLDRLRVTRFNTKFNACSSLLDQAQHASWIMTEKSWEESGCLLGNDDERELFSPTLDLCSGQERNLLNRLEDMKAYNGVKRIFSF